MKLLRYRENIILIVLLILSLVQYRKAIAQDAVIQEEQQTIKTYPFGDPDPVPTLAQNKEHIYPYFSFDRYSRKAQSQKWKVVRLENDYIEVAILPEVGGKIWGAVEKSTGEEFIYKNDVMKFRNIALRGPWTSGGIEFNFGIIGHAPTTATPVDYLIQKNEDGSVSCTVGALDLSSRTEWRVTITLPKDKAYFETESLWYNPTPLDQSYYVWMNAAVKAAEDLQFFFPGEHYIGHSGDAHPWPVNNDGVDLSYYKNNDFGPSKSYHVLGKKTEYFGGYWHNKDFGFGHWSSYDNMPGKKLWIWSLSRSGAIWEDLLTDTDGQYVEVQSGRLFSQANVQSNSTPFNQVAFHPTTTDSWKEIWFPIKATEGMSAASPHAVVHLDRKGGKAEIRLMALQSIDDDLQIIQNGKLVHEKHVSLKPMEMHRESISLPQDTKNLKLVLGNHKLVYTDSSSYLNLDRPVSNPDNNNQKNCAHELFRQAENQVKSRNYNAALESYKTVLEKSPDYQEAYVGLANLYYRRGEYQQALENAEHALIYDTYNVDANYIYGIINAQKGDHVQALEALGWAARSIKYRSVSYSAMAEIYLKDSQLNRAIEYANRSLDFNRKNINAHKILAIAHRKHGETKNAQSALNNLIQIDPLNHFARFEQYLLNPSTKNLEAFTSLIRNELPHETYLELAIFYSNVNLESEANKVLLQAPSHPMVFFWQAYLQKNTFGKNSNQYLDKALASSPHLVFPFRWESIPMLKWAQGQQNSWKTSYYLGLIYWGKGRKEEAIQLFDQLNEIPDYGPFYITRGKLRQILNYSETEVLTDFKKARQLDSTEWRTWNTLSKFLLDNQKLAEALRISREANKKFPGNDAIEMIHAKSLLYNAKYLEALTHLNQIHILPFEGAREGHTLFEQTNIFLALEMIQKEDYHKALKYLENSKKWPEHLGVGKPYNPDNRLQNFLEAYIYQHQGRDGQAEQLLTSIVNYTESHRDSWRPNHFISALAFKKLGQDDKAKKLINNWNAARPNDSIANWSASQFEQDSNKVQAEGQEPVANKLKTNIPLLLLIETMNSIDGY